MDLYGKAPLHYSAEVGDYETVMLLIQLGADLNICDKAGCTPAAYADSNAHFEVLDKLQSMGGRNISNLVNKAPEEASKAEFLKNLSITKLSDDVKFYLNQVDKSIKKRKI